MNRLKRSYFGHNMIIWSLVILFSFALLLPSVSSVQLGNDDGSNEATMLVSSNGYAVKISPTSTGMLTSVDAYLNQPGFVGMGNAYSMDSGHNISQSTFGFVPSGGYAWRNSALTNEEYSSDFYVGYGKLTALGSIDLGSDNTAPNSKSEYSNNMNDSSGYAVDSSNNYLIRANFNYYPLVSNMLVNPDPTNINPLLTATCTDSESSITGAWYRIDGAGWIVMNSVDGAYDSSTENVSSTISIISLAEGSHLVELVCGDTTGYFTKPIATTNFFVDTVAPTSNITLNPGSPNGLNNWYTTNVNFDLSAIDTPGSGINSIFYNLSGAHSTGGFIPYTTTVTLSNDGLTTIGFYSVDNAGNAETFKWATVKIDQTPPSTPVLSAFPNDYINGLSETVSWSASSDSASLLDYYTIYREVNSGGFGVLTTSVPTFYIDLTLVNDNIYNYYITATDNAGNTSTASNQDWFGVDRSSPSDPFLSALPTFTGNAGTVNLNWTASNDPGIFPSGINSYGVNEDAVITNVGLVLAYSDAGNADTTTHEYKIKALDNSIPVNYSHWSNTETTTIDLTAPVTTATILPTTPDGGNGWYISPVQTTLTAVDPNSPSSGIAATYYCIDNVAACVPTTLYTGSFIISTEGTNFVTFYSVDNVGNTESPASIGPIKIDLSSPYNQDILLDAGAIYNITGNVNAGMNIGIDDFSGLNYCDLSWDNGGTWNNVGLAVVAGPHAYADGLQTAQYKCYDNAGHVSSTVLDDIIVDTTPPISDITNLDALEDVFKGNTLITGNSFDASSGIDFVEIKIENRNADDSGWDLLLDWTTVNGSTDWNYSWDSSTLPTTHYRLSSRATDNASWEETNSDIQSDRIRIELINNTSPSLENIYYENSGKDYILLHGFLDLANWDYTIEVFDSTEGLSGTTIYSYPITTDNNTFFSLDIDASGWNTSKLYTARVLLHGGETLYSQFGALYQKSEPGFKDILTNTYVSSYYVNTVKVPISFALEPEISGQYKIQYKMDGNWKTLKSCSWFNEGEKNYRNGNMNLTSTGVKKIKLRAKNCSTLNIDYTSYIFKIRHVDLADSLTAYTTIVSPVENSDMTYPYPVGSIEDNVYWTQSGNVPLISYLNTNTEEDRPICEVFYYDEYGVERHIGNYPSIELSPTDWICDANALNFNTGEWNSINKNGNYTKLRVYNDVVAQADSYDDLNVGIDNDSPVITSITPDESGIMNGIYTWYSDITDNLSGIEQVNFYLIEKDDYSYCIDANCWTGAGAIVWSILDVNYNTGIGKFYYDLNTLNHPDGDYNVAFEAYDIAGNYSYLEVDPVIDNTPPKINSITVTKNPIIRGRQFVVDANVTDNLTGVNTVTATISLGGFSETLNLTKSGNIYSGLFATDINWNIGLYSLLIDANDMAGNTVSSSIDVNVFEDYIFNLSLDSATKIKGNTGTIFGQLVSDTGRKVNDENVTIDSLFFGPVIVLTDINGFFEQGFTTTTSGTFDINVNYSDVNTNYLDSIVLVVNNPAPPIEPEAPPQGGGGGGGGGGSPSASALLRVSPLTIELNEEVDVSVLCKWSFGCRLKINGNAIAEMGRVAGFQEYPQTFTSAGKYIIGLYHKGTTDTLVAEKIVTVNAEEVQVPVKEEEKPVLNSTETQPTNNNPIEESAQEEEPEETLPPTGFFGLGGFDFENFDWDNMFGLFQLLGLIVGLGMLYVGRSAIGKK